MSRSQRDKGQRGERELAHELSELLGTAVERRVRNKEGDNDLVGVKGWSVECKRTKALELPKWWRQTIEQAKSASEWPVLFYRLDGKKWRAVWPLAALLFNSLDDVSELWFYLEMTAETSLEGWAAVYRERLGVTK